MVAIAVEVADWEGFVEARVVAARARKIWTSLPSC